MRDFLARFAKDQSGATAIEYGILASLMAVLLIAAVTSLGTGLKGNFNNVGNAVK